MLAARELHPGMGQAVAERTILRKIPTLPDVNCLTVSRNDPVIDEIIAARPDEVAIDESNSIPHFQWRWESWAEVAERVALGNTSLRDAHADFEGMRDHLLNATILMSGRHLQHGDANQSQRNLEVFSNCSTAAASFLLFYLLLNGAGVGRSYDDDMMLVNWDHAPNVRCVLDDGHPDFDYSAHESARDARHKYGKSEQHHWFVVPDSREGWGQAIEMYETMAFQKAYRDDILILDFSRVRCKGSPIAGMQNRPSSGPVPLMNAIHKTGTLKGAGLPKWFQAMYVDHYAAEPVLVGGARRAARMAVKFWKDRSVLDFIRIKRPIEFEGLSMQEIINYRKKHGNPLGFLWSSNNSVGVDKEFWQRLAITPDQEGYNAELTRHAREVHRLVTECSYGDGTGEPGYLNLDQLVQKDVGQTSLLDGSFVGSKRYKVSDQTKIYLSGIAKKASGKKYWTIVNPCGEIPLSLYGGYCVIGSAIPFHADTLAEAEDAFRTITRALIRVNTMDNIYSKETKRTNRIGVGQLGVHEFAWKFFKVGFRKLINPDFEGYLRFSETYGPEFTHAQIINDALTLEDAGIRAAAFWECQGHFSRSVMREAFDYSGKLGLARPHTTTMVAPNGTISKLFGLTEGWHLPALAHYLRWVQFRHDDPLVPKYKAAGYQTRDLVKYEGTTIVGFPTAPTIADLGMGDELVLAGDASPSEQYKWLQLGEYFWIEGGSISDFVAGKPPRPNEERFGGQISYTLKYKPEETKFDKFLKMLTEGQPTVRACSVMPQVEANSTAYEYLPEEQITKAEFESRMRDIQAVMEEDIGREHVECAGGACPITFKETASV